MNTNCSLVLLSGGKGKRFKSFLPKQYLPLHGKPLVLHALDAALRIKEISEIIVVSHPDYYEIFSSYPIKLAPAGIQRQDSVLSGLKKVSHPWVLIHDGVRPFLYSDDIFQLLEAVQKTGAAALASDIPYTIKQRDPVQTINRDHLAMIHTPQCLKTSLLLEGLSFANKHNLTLSDDTQAAEILGIPTSLVFTSHPQIKITYPEDLTIAHALL
ncbi:2-C-methyl-D-erythritol 4-phosphate cytidylyltransferase [Chlamydia avium]|uniref:2-C-methyl-D-erythritol 4-phosphate cytidylyltransferase n=2 Tax=Chlamydia avium TaxID=1457141 RepID=W8JI15_9CHLA|nr:2-C-methyl-D-erythritol 4-phosphate cytidylyltransferase [Chlamydia avium]AHK63810.1 2-C-methyl-D-erythritol 4-phosphate cytidylyltransferase [Chlamydia avium 10DC88]EPP36566.1 2-C-methyl-D-erythritol 4-phosphate cytidylyltransferase [Chlamydia psittaci 10_743_SC13]EPP38858.1 2-C-methyl-D-erythritol 4-phosphate cytidylyltransferase [Chlamydia avium]VVT43390.1 2-C-methyl-D-erythritol 4-phosphate cytidylyltransferase [Chlamydia avium]